VGKCEADASGPGQRQVTHSYGHGNKRSDSIKDGEFMCVFVPLLMCINLGLSSVAQFLKNHVLLVTFNIL